MYVDVCDDAFMYASIYNGCDFLIMAFQVAKHVRNLIYKYRPLRALPRHSVFFGLISFISLKIYFYEKLVNLCCAAFRPKRSFSI